MPTAQRHRPLRGLMGAFARRAALPLLLLAAGTLRAQSDPLQSLYLNDKLLINPAYAGVRDGLALTAQYRHQWVGIEGAPRTTVLSAHAPLKGGRYGLGVTLHDDRIGPVQSTGLRAAYAYRVPAGPGTLALGLNGALAWHRAGLAGLDLIDEDDPAFAQNENRLLPNAGFGVYYDWNDQAFFSASVPRLLRGAYLPGGDSREGRQYTASAGYVQPAGEHLRLRGMLLWRAAESAPSAVEADLAVEALGTVWLGGGYRSSGAAKAYVQANLPAGLGIGYAYDIDFGAVAPPSAGSHEIFLRYDLPSPGAPAALSPRGSGHRTF
jgi:type IX secretion system PorP/SprF family membrane protein